jgi:hypothetical protein
LSRRAHAYLDASAIVFYCAAIFYLSSIPIDCAPVYPFPGFDKVAHVGLYAGLGLLVCRFAYGDLRRNPVSTMLISASFTILYGFSDEVHQSFVPTRYAAASDFAANMAGALLAVAVWYFLFRPKRKPLLLLQAQPQTEKVADDVQI